MWRRKNCCGGRTNPFRLLGIILISLGAGIFLAHIIPQFLLITLLGIGLIVCGVCSLIRK